MKQLIIQCPSCQTKFALDSTAVEGIEEPRFHCSRCDHVFSVEENKPVELEAPALAAVPRERPLLEEVKKPSPPPPLSPPLIERTAPSRALEIPSITPHQNHFTPPHESAEEEETERERNKSRQAQMEFAFQALDAAVNDETSSTIEQDIEPLSPDSLKVQPPWPPSAEGESETGQETPSIGFQIPAPAPVETSAANVQVFPQASLASSAASDSPFRGWRGVALLVSPLAAFLALIMAASLFMQMNPDTAMLFSDTLLRGAPRLAPAGVFMANTSMKRVILDSGESIFVLSGKVKNESSRTYKQMYLEAIAFDQAGKPMSFTKVDAGSTLAKTRIKALTPEMIHNLQSASGAKEWSLKPGAESEFAIAMGEVLSGDDFSAARYFSARIHSVKY